MLSWYMLYINENMKWWLYGTGSIFKQNRRMQFVQKLFILILCLEEIALMPSDKLFPELCTHIRMQNFKARINVFTLFLETVRLLFNIYSFCRHISVLLNLKMKVFLISFVHLSNVSNVWIVFFNFQFWSDTSWEWSSVGGCTCTLLFLVCFHTVFWGGYKLTNLYKKHFWGICFAH